MAKEQKYAGICVSNPTQAAGRAKKARKSKKTFVFAGILILVGLAIIGSVLWMSQEANPLPSPNEAEQTEDEDGFPDVDWEYWQKVNPDVIGWITIKGTKVNYPILQAHSDDPAFYLHHDIKGNWSVYGVPYLDADCKGGLFGSSNAIIYGHHMDDGSMFAAVSSYSTDKKFAKKHAKVLVQTPTEKKVMNVRFAQIVNAANATKFTSFADDLDYLDWYEGELDNARTVLDADTRPNNVLTLCTCSYNVFKNERTLVTTSEKNGKELDWDE